MAGPLDGHQYENQACHAQNDDAEEDEAEAVDDSCHLDPLVTNASLVVYPASNIVVVTAR